MSAPTVLVADDSAPVRTVVGRLLQSRGFEVVDAADGREALDVARRVRPDVILLDVEMPHLNGHDVLRALNADHHLSAIPVVFLSAHDRGDEVVAALRLGGHDYIRKPFDPEDLVARVHAAARTSALAQELQQRNRELEEFAVRATHDLKSPLTVVMGLAETLAERWDVIPEDERNHFLGRISQAAARASAMVSDLLDLARAGRQPTADAEPVDAREVARAVVADADLEDETAIEGEWVPVRMPEPALRSVLANLVDNASFYGRDDDGGLDLRIRAWPAAEGLHVVVEDHGPGVDPAEAPQLFEPFYRSPRTRGRNPRSTGVGLAIVARTLEQWGGSVVLEHVEPHGTALHMLIPR